MTAGRGGPYMRNLATRAVIDATAALAGSCERAESPISQLLALVRLFDVLAFTCGVCARTRSNRFRWREQRPDTRGTSAWQSLQTTDKR